VQQLHDAVDLVVAVVHALHQRPLVLDGVAGGPRVGTTCGHQFGRRDAGSTGQQLFAQARLGGVQAQRQRRAHLSFAQRHQAFEGTRIAHGAENQVLVPVPEEGAADAPAWHAACAVSELIEGAALASVRGRRLMMITVDERMYAFDDFCPHSGGPMHRGEFDLGDRGRELHGLTPLRMYPVRVLEGEVQVFL